MKNNHMTNAQEYFKVVDDCKGRVELLTGEGVLGIHFLIRFISLTSRSMRKDLVL